MKTQNKFASSLFNNWAVKVLAFLSAVFIVLSVRFFNINDRTVTIPLEVILPEGRTAISLVPETVDVIISGSDSVIYLIDPAQIKASADFSEVDEEGIARVRVALEYNENIYTERGLTLDVNPEIVRILFQ